MKEYTYSVARVRAKESELLTAQEIDRLIAASDYEDAKRQIIDKSSEKELFGFLKEIAPEEILQFVCMPIDYHNIKASVKAVFSDTDASGLLLDYGTEDKNVIYESVKKREYSSIEPTLADTAEEAMKLLLKTHDGQLCDIFIDKAQQEAEMNVARKSCDSFLIKYMECKADLMNLKTALRCAIMKRNADFIKNVLFAGGTLNAASIADAAADGIDSFAEYINGTSYSDGANYINSNAAEFEKWCDNKLTERIENAKYENFSSAPIFAYAHAKQTELNAVRMILAAKESHIDSDIIRERVRRLYA